MELLFMMKAIELGRCAMEKKTGGPFGAIIVKEGVIIGQGQNRVTSRNDPTAHAEIDAIRKACKKIEHFDLSGCIIYSSCEPCPMCLGAIYWARISTVYYAANRKDASKAGFSDKVIYDEMPLPPAERSISMKQGCREEAIQLFDEWKNIDQKTLY